MFFVTFLMKQHKNDIKGFEINIMQQMKMM